MSVSSVAVRDAAFLTPLAHGWRTILATTGATIKRDTAYLINVIREPLLPAVLFLTMSIAYASGRA